MLNIQKHKTFVNAQIDHYDRMAVKSRSNPTHLKIYTEVADGLRALLTDLENESNAESPQISVNPLDTNLMAKLPPGFLSNPLSLMAADIVGTPEDLIKQLNISESDKQEIAIVDLINAAGGTLLLDKIILGVFYLTGMEYQRNTITAKLYRMSRKGLVFGVPKKKGIYTTTRPDQQEDEENIEDLA
jgi:hypothetical protein